MATIEELYQQVLGRAPDPEGLAFWRSIFGDSVDEAEAAQFRQSAAPELASRNTATNSDVSSRTATVDPTDTTVANANANANANADPADPAEVKDPTLYASQQKMLDKDIWGPLNASDPGLLQRTTNLIQDVMGQQAPVYTGPRVAGPSALESQAWAGLSGLAMPSNVMGDVIGKLGGVYDKYLAGPQYYTPADYSSLDFQRPETYVPGTLDAQYVAPEAYSPTTFESRLAGFTPGAYNPTQFADPYDYTAREIQTGLGPVKSVEGYMNPYVQNVVDVQSREARRNAEIQRQTDAARFAKSAAFGGGRQAIVESEAARNLATLLDDITAKGYSTAYDKAQLQRLTEAERFQRAQTDTAAGERAVASDQAKFNLEAAGMSEASKQFGYNKEIDWARLLAGDALEAQKLSEQSKQFGYGQQMSVADKEVDAEIRIYQAQEAARQQATRLGVDVEKAVFDAGLEALKQSDVSEQARERLGLEYLTGARGAANDIVNLYGAKQAQGIALAKAQAEAGGVQRDIIQKGYTADFDDFIRQEEFKANQLKTVSPLLGNLMNSTGGVEFRAESPDALNAIIGTAVVGSGLLTNNQTTGNQSNTTVNPNANTAVNPNAVRTT